MPEANRQAQGFNQLCGDSLTLYLKVEDHKISAISFHGSGCAISISSASLMSEIVQGKTIAEAETLFQIFHQLLTGEVPSPEKIAHLEKLAVFSGVRAYPVRIKCASLAWHTLLAALEEKIETVSTED
jgi:nitrogen fixation NifU-like protein